MCGSAIGAPIGGFWSPMAVSPPRPRAWAASLERDDDYDVTAERLCISTPTGDDGDVDDSPVLECVAPLWAHALSALPEPTMLLFEEALTPDVVPLQGLPRRLRVRAPVAIRKVSFGSLAWQPLVEEGAEVGVVYHLGNSPDDARVEVRVPGSVAVVQADYSLGGASASSLLLFAEPETHLASLRLLHAQLQRGDEIGYLPSQELCITPAFDRLVLRANPALSGERNDAARRTWLKTKTFLRSISTLTADCIAAYTHNEIKRVRAFELSDELARWRASVL